MLTLLQASEWPPSAVHDTVAAIARGIEYRRSIRQSLLDRAFLWVAQGLERLVDFIRHLPASRAIGLTVLGIIVGLIVVRVVIAALARDETGARTRRRAGVVSGEDPFLVADRFAAEGRFEDAAHSLYHGVLLSLARTDRVRLDPSKTSGDYARELRARGAAAYQPFRAFSRRFDVAVFGHGGCDAPLIDDLRRLAAPFAPRARAA
ncbi:MAG TPA: DUF4129 domain-containing protein [Gemmatimonadaceae bacterium]|nr:DUF4129 domain-containing protein [Gemmatimonadaceae bacterium]